MNEKETLAIEIGERFDVTGRSVMRQSRAPGVFDSAVRKLVDGLSEYASNEERVVLDQLALIGAGVALLGPAMAREMIDQ